MFGGELRERVQAALERVVFHERRVRGALSSSTLLREHVRDPEVLGNLNQLYFTELESVFGLVPEAIAVFGC